VSYGRDVLRVKEISMSDATDLIDMGHDLHPDSEFWDSLSSCNPRCSHYNKDLDYDEVTCDECIEAGK
jgi:hypothetical protein